MVKKCAKTGKEFAISEREKNMLEQMRFPLPRLCPDERLRRRLTYRNERKLYKMKCDLTGKPIVSIYSEDKPFKVFSQEAWWSDKWDSKDYSRDYDFNRGFFEQFYELSLVVPRIALLNQKAENSEYCNVTTDNKNCYLVFGGDFNEDCMYSSFCMHSQNCFDTYWVNECQLCYECIDTDKSYNCRFCHNVFNCRDSAFLFDCRACSDCYFCVGLVNKKYHIFNKAYEKEEYFKKIKEFDLKSFKKLCEAEKKFEEFRLKFPHRSAYIVNCEDVSGDHIVNAKNCENVFDISGPAKDLKDVWLGGWNLKDVFSADHCGHGCEKFYEMLGSVSGYNNAFSVFSWNSNDILYSQFVVNNCHDLFGCLNMKKEKYCILNKQYKEKEYFDLKKRIIEHMKRTGEWGEFFPMKYSPFSYNETIAQDIFPMTKEKVLEEGLKWTDEEKNEIGSGAELPDNIDDVDENILNKSLVCAKTGRPYKINDIELKFYKNFGIPLPKFAPETRNEFRLKKRNPIKLWQIKCAKCGADVMTSYSPDRPEIVYCEKCYLAEKY